MVETLSQAEIEALLAALEGGDSKVVSGQPVGGTRSGPKQVKSYDFRRPDKFAKDHLRALTMIMEVFTRSWGTFMSAKLRSMVYLEVQAIDQMTYEEFTNSLATPTVVAVFTMEPLEGSALLEVRLPLAFTILDRLLGGRGFSSNLRRELTEIEEAIMSGIVSDMWSYLRNAFKDIVPVSPRLESLESNPQFVQIVPPGDIVLYISLSMKIGEMVEQIVFCFPYILLEPALSKLSTEQFFAGRREATVDPRQMTETLRDVPIPVRAELGSARLNVREVMSLATGDVVKLDQRVRDALRVQVHNRVKFLGRPGLYGESYAIEITHLVDDLGALGHRGSGGGGTEAG